MQTLADKKLLEEIIQKKVTLAALESSSENAMSVSDVAMSQEQILEPKLESQTELPLEAPVPIKDEETLEEKGDDEILSPANSESEIQRTQLDERSKKNRENDFAKSQDNSLDAKDDEALASESFTTKSDCCNAKTKTVSPVILPQVDIGEGLFF